MSFYGKIFSEMGEVFSLFHFKNTDGKTTTNFISEEERLKNFDLGAESFNDKLIMKAGNSWIQFKQIKNPLPNETGEAVEIYHSQPMKGAASDGGSRLVISDIIFDDNEQYNKLISGDSDLLTQEEKEALMEARANNLLFFGDTINIQSPQFDKAGHITGYKTETYKISEIPRLEEFLDMSNDVIELQEIVGVTGYPETSAKGTLGQRVKALEDDFESAKDSADNADEAAKNATEKANQAAADAEAARKLSEQTYQDLNDYKDFTNERLSTANKNFSDIVEALGFSTDEQIAWEKPDLEDPNLFNWMKEQDSRLNNFDEALGFVNSEEIAANKPDLSVPNLLYWMIEQDDRLDTNDVNYANLTEALGFTVKDSIISQKPNLEQPDLFNWMIDQDNRLTKNEEDLVDVNERLDKEIKDRNADIKKLTDDHNTDRQNLQNSINNLSNTHNTDKQSLQEQITTLSNTHNTDKQSLQDQITTLSNTHNSDKQELTSTITANKTDIENKLSTAVQILNASLSTSESGVRTDLTNLQNVVSSNKTELTNLINSNKEALDKKDNDLDGRITTNNTAISSLSGEVEVLKTLVNTNTTNISTNTSNISANATNIGINANNINTNTSNISSLVETIAEMSDIITQLQNRIAILEGYHPVVEEEEPETPTE